LFKKVKVEGCGDGCGDGYVEVEDRSKLSPSFGKETMTRFDVDQGRAVM
jgi:hypothetical protein